MELQLDRLFDGPPAGYTAKAQAASLAPVPEPLSFRHFSHDMLQVCISSFCGRLLLAAPQTLQITVHLPATIVSRKLLQQAGRAAVMVQLKYLSRQSLRFDTPFVRAAQAMA